MSVCGVSGQCPRFRLYRRRTQRQPYAGAGATSQSRTAPKAQEMQIRPDGSRVPGTCGVSTRNQDGHEESRGT